MQRASELLSFVPKVVKDWTVSIAIGTFLLYLFGYLSLRFHLTVLGVGTDLSALDERYLFAGARFLVFFGSCLPYVAVAGALLWAVGALVWRRSPTPAVLLGAGLIFALAMIGVMRACFALTATSLPFAVPGSIEPRWVEWMLRASDTAKSLYFTGLTLAVAATWTALGAAMRGGVRQPWERAMAMALTAFAGIMTLLLPVNHGALLVPYEIGRTNSVGKTAVPAGQNAWVLWEGSERVSYFVKSPAERTIVSVPLKTLERLERSSSESLTEIVLGPAVRGPVLTQNEPWWQRAARSVGMSNTGLALKGWAQDPAAGDIWMVRLEGDLRVPSLRAAGAFRWPVLAPGQNRIYAMQGDDLVRMPVAGGAAERIGALPRVLRLVGFDRNGGRLLVLVARDDRHFDAVWYSPAGVAQETAAANVDRQDEGARPFLAETSSYGAVLVSSENGRITVDREVADYCDPATCSQSSYSPEPPAVVYIKTTPSK